MSGFMNPDGSELVGGQLPSGVGQSLQLDNSGNLKTTATVTPPSSAVSTGNSSTALLAGGATFTGAWESALAYGSISVQAFADQASAASGLIIEQSQDGTNADTQAASSVLASTAFQQTVNLTGQYFRVVYTNGGSNQGTFRLQTIKEVGISPSAGVANQRVNAHAGDFVDGAIVVEGATTDAAVVGDVAGTNSAKLRGLSKILNAVWDNVNGLLNTNTSRVGGTAIDTNSGNKSAGTQRVVLATDQPALTNKLLVTPDSVALPAHQSTNVDQLNGTTTDTNSGVKSAGTLRVVLATDQPALTNKLLVTPDSVALPAHQSTNVDQLNGTTTDTNSGNKSAGTLRVVLATDQPALTNALLMQDVAGTSGGSTPYHAISAASTNSTNVKGSAGQLYGLSISNSNAAARFFKLYDKATAPTVGTDTPKRTIQIPANGTVITAFPVGLNFASGIGYGLTTGIADADTGAVGTDISVDLDYK